MRVIYLIFDAGKKWQISFTIFLSFHFGTWTNPKKTDTGPCIIENIICVSLALGQRPTLESVSYYGLCDIRQQDCTRVRVAGNNFIDNQNLSCKMTEATVSNWVFFKKAWMT